MNCYTHTENPAIGICRTCGRGVCKSCHDASATATALSCSESCTEKSIIYDEINERAERIYSIGRYKHNQPKIPTQTAILLIMATLLFIITLIAYDNLTDPVAILSHTITGSLFITALFSWYRSNKQGINF